MVAAARHALLENAAGGEASTSPVGSKTLFHSGNNTCDGLENPAKIARNNKESDYAGRALRSNQLAPINSKCD